MVCAVRVPMQNSDFAETSFTGQTDLTVVQYSPTDQDLPGNKQFNFWGNAVKVNCIWDRTCNASVVIPSKCTKMAVTRTPSFHAAICEMFPGYLISPSLFVSASLKTCSLIRSNSSMRSRMSSSDTPGVYILSSSLRNNAFTSSASHTPFPSRSVTTNPNQWFWCHNKGT